MEQAGQIAKGSKFKPKAIYYIDCIVNPIINLHFKNSTTCNIQNTHKG